MWTVPILTKSCAGPSYFPEHINVHSRQWVTRAWKHRCIFFTHSSPFAVVITLKKYRAGTSLPETATSEDQLNRRDWDSSRPGSHKHTLSLSSLSQEIREQSSIAFSWSSSTSSLWVHLCIYPTCHHHLELKCLRFGFLIQTENHWISMYSSGHQHRLGLLRYSSSGTEELLGQPNV